MGYKALTDAQMTKWSKKSEQDKLRYQEEMKTYIPMDDPTGGKRKKAKKDPNAPKRKILKLPLVTSHGSSLPSTRCSRMMNVRIGGKRLPKTRYGTRLRWRHTAPECKRCIHLYCGTQVHQSYGLYFLGLNTYVLSS